MLVERDVAALKDQAETTLFEAEREPFLAFLRVRHWDGLPKPEYSE